MTMTGEMQIVSPTAPVTTPHGPDSTVAATETEAGNGGPTVVATETEAVNGDGDLTDKDTQPRRKRKRNRKDGVPPLSLIKGFLDRPKARAIRRLFKKKPNEITYAPFPSDNMGSFAFMYLEPLVDAVKNREVLNIIDRKSQTVLHAIGKAREYGFGGPWIDTLEELINKNQKFSLRQREPVEVEIDGLTSDLAVLKTMLKLVEDEIQYKEAKMKMAVEKMNVIQTARSALTYVYYSAPEE